MVTLVNGMFTVNISEKSVRFMGNYEVQNVTASVSRICDAASDPIQPGYFSAVYRWIDGWPNGYELIGK